MTSDASKQITIGDRLCYGYDRCTVRYIGAVKGTTGSWLGVEWDDPTRGKHSGGVNGEEYFACRIPNSGSFIRPDRPYKPPRSFIQAIREKYIDNLEEAAKPVEFGTKVAQEIGFDKISKRLAEVKELQYVILDGCVISRAEDEVGEIFKTCPNVKELDISRNMFSSLEPIAEICASLQLVTNLKINGNRFSSFSLPKSLSKAFYNIKELGLEDQNLSWDEISLILSHFPILTSISVALNNLSDLRTSSVPLPQTLQIFSAEENKFSQLAELSPLRHMPNLCRLELKRNNISTTSVVDHDEKLEFPNIKYLDVSFNEVSEWKFIDDLRVVMPNMQALRLSHNPLFQDESKWEERFMLTVARLKRSVKAINYGKITDSERLNAELYLLSHIVKELSEAPKEEEQSILSKYPRWQELQELHGEQTVVRRNKEDNSRTLESKLIDITLIHRCKTTTKRLPQTLTISKAKAVIGQIFAIKPLKLVLMLQDSTDEVMEDEFKELDYYIEGRQARILVQEV